MSAVAAIHTAIRAGLSRTHLIAPTTADMHDVNLEGRPASRAPRVQIRCRNGVGKRRLEWPTGAQCVFFSGEEPEGLRGHQAEIMVIDEIARMRNQQARAECCTNRGLIAPADPACSRRRYRPSARISLLNSGLSFDLPDRFSLKIRSQPGRQPGPNGLGFSSLPVHSRNAS
jgi:hypothetical protein